MRGEGWLFASFGLSFSFIAANIWHWHSNSKKEKGGFEKKKREFLGGSSKNISSSHVIA